MIFIYIYISFSSGKQTPQQALLHSDLLELGFFVYYFFFKAVIILFIMYLLTVFSLLLLLPEQETSILEEYNINWTQKLGAGISGPVR